jgi:hypothetical protein
MTKPLDIVDEPQGPNRTPLILGIIAGVLAVAVIIALVLLVTRPSGDQTTAPPAPEQSEPVDPEPQPPAPDESAEQPEEVPTTAQVAVNGLGLTITQADGTEFTHAWADDPAAAIEALTELFGEAPAEDFQNGDAENWAYDIYVWDGFRFYDVFLGGGGRSRDEVPAPTYVAITGTTPAEVGIVDEFGVAVGDSMDEARAQDPTDEVDLSDGRVRLAFGNNRGTFYTDGKRAFSAFVESDASTQTVASITYTFRARGQ